jgi:hypothetical protein
MTYAELLNAIDDEIDETECTNDRVLAYQLRYEVEDLFDNGRVDDAVRRLECFVSPKWQSLEACEYAYNEAMNR